MKSKYSIWVLALIIPVFYACKKDNRRQPVVIVSTLAGNGIAGFADGSPH